MSELQTVKPYANTDEFMSALAIKDRRAMTKTMADLAHAGNIYAANFYGDMLMGGVWDEDRMKFDLARGQLLPPTDDPRRDPYFILGRDPRQAIEFYKYACRNSDFLPTSAFKEAFRKIDYCHRKGLAGFQADRTIPNPYLSFAQERYLKENGKNSLKSGSGEFVPIADARVEVDNPRTAMFKNLGLNQYQASMAFYIAYAVLTALLMAIIMGLFGDYSGGFRTVGFVVMTNIIPLMGFHLAFETYGYNQSLPTCSCAKIREAYMTQLERLPPECRGTEDPFVKTNYLIRNLVGIRRLWFYWYMIIASVIVTGRLEHLEFLNWMNLSMLVSILFFILLSTVVIMWDKKIPEGWDFKLPLRILSSLFYFAFDDAQCEEEIKRLDRKSGLEFLIEDTTKATF